MKPTTICRTLLISFAALLLTACQPKVSAYYPGDCYRAWLSGKDNSGDATVPGHSGLAPRPHVPFFARMGGFEHQGSYQQSHVQAVTLYSILSLAVEVPKLA